MRKKIILFYLIWKIVFGVMQHHVTADDEQIPLLLPKRDDQLLCIQSDHSVFEEDECHQKKEKRFAFGITYESESRHE